MIGDSRTYTIDELDENEHYDKIFYKDRWIKEDLSDRKLREGAKPLEQHLIISFSLKYKNYQRKIRQGQIDRAQELIKSGRYKQRPKNQNDPHRFMARTVMTEDEEVCAKEAPYLNTDKIAEEETYDGFYAVCTNLDEVGTDQIKAHFLTCFIALFIFRILEKKPDEKYSCERIMRTLREMTVYRPGEKLGYLPSYTRTDLTDALHEAAGFRTDYEILTDISMKKVIRSTKKK
ncbi:transposase [Lachnospiraceae bacterium 47-T17]